LRNKIEIKSQKDLDLNLENSWHSQQIIKLFIYKIVTSEYYIMLDSKNHFMDYIDLDVFFIESKPKLKYNNNVNTSHSLYQFF
jgi:hypothetical protein